MSRFGRLVLIVVLVLGAMVLLTYINPDIRAFATGLSGGKLPLWLVGLAAPILFVFRKLADLLGSLVGEGRTEKGIREKNEAIAAKLDRLERDVQQLDQWRQAEIERRRAAVARHEAAIAPLEERKAALDQEIAALLERTQALQQLIRDESGTIP